MTRTLSLNQVIDSEVYRIDLVQDDRGYRWIHVRRDGDDRHPDSALTTIAISGVQLRNRLNSGSNQEEVVAEGGEAFVLDGHHSWMLNEEALFWKKCRKLDESEWSSGPWVNGKIPAQYAS